MAIRINYGNVADYAALGKLAGQATAAREAAARQDAINRQAMQMQAQQAAQAHQREMAEFDAYLDMHKYKAAQAWEVEKMELRSRHDFEMIEARREAEFQNQLQQEMRQQQELDMKLKTLAEKAPVEMGGDGFLTRQQYEDAVMKVQGLPTPKRTGVDFRKLEQDYQYYLDTVGSYKRGHDFKWGPGQRLGVGVLNEKGKVVREATPEEVSQLEYAERRLGETREQLSPQPTNRTSQLSNVLRQQLPSLSVEERVTVQKIIDSGDENRMYEVLRLLGGK